ncbi:hypothetical protein [Rickettsiella massiliensis]|uniref:hypothetical protein n=1 Tax=Rickettsiella massiliensis TaxID=676517 RepID=UPI0002F3B6DF|nr:hypothetical protein [Rickettsiella massiliensis]
MYNLLLKEPLIKAKNCIGQAKKNLNIHTEHSNHSENKNNEISGNDLHSVLTDIKELVNQKIWCEKGISFFGKKIPEGIKKLTNVLDNTQLTEIQKLKAIKVILMKKCENRSFFRASCTNKLYKDLLTALEPCVPYDKYKKNKIALRK